MSLAAYVGELSTWDFVALFALAVVVLNILRRRLFPQPVEEPVIVKIEPMQKQDFYTNELKQYNGSREDGRLLLGCDGKVFDVTIAKAKYGPGGPYHNLVGRDASRALATFDLGAPPKDEYDDLSDLGAADIQGMKEWAQDFEMRYTVVGKLLKPGEERGVYPKEDDTESEDKKSK